MRVRPPHIVAAFAAIILIAIFAIAAKRTPTSAAKAAAAFRSTSAPAFRSASADTFNTGPATYYLRGDGQWATTAMIGSTATAPGTAGFVPPPVAGDRTNFLRGDGQWALQPPPPVMGPATTVAAGSAGIVPAPTPGANTQFLRGDGTWAAGYAMNMYYYIASAATFTLAAGSVAGAVPFAAVPSTRGTAITTGFNDVAATASATVPVNQFALAPGYTYSIVFGFSQVVATPGTPTYTPPTVGIVIVNGAGTSATYQTVSSMTLVPTTVAYGKYYCPGVTLRAYLTPTTTTKISAFIFNGATTDTMFAPWMSIDVI
jgi:hypothetical protein